MKLPHHLRREKRRVSVLIESDIDERGHVEARVKRSSGDKDLDEVVLRAARKTRFKPRQEDGVATKTKKETRYDIGVEDSENNSENDDDDSP